MNNVAVIGCLGRVGKVLTAKVKKLGYNVVEIDKDYCVNELTDLSCVIDFSLPEATPLVVSLCKKYNCPLVSGVTNHTEQQQKDLEELGKTVPVIHKQNFSCGIQNLLEVCHTFAQNNPTWDCEIIEYHHHNKKDSPSGTAKLIATTVSQARGSFNSIVIHSVRCGSNFGKHEVIFATNGESVTFTHQAENVDIFAEGAIREMQKVLKKQ